MKIFITDDGLWMAVYKHRTGAVCCGYAPSMREAMTFCAELVTARDRAPTRLTVVK